MNELIHPLVSEYLSRFDAESLALSPARRSSLREEIEGHLRDAIASDSADAEAAAAISEFGSPAEIIAQELDDLAPAMSNRRRPGVRPLVIVSIVAAVALAIPVGIFLAAPSGAGFNPGPPSVVNAAPEGPPRVTEGQAYFEYLAAIDAMEHPLPPGAEYPDGVPKGLDAGPDGREPLGIMESGAGTHLAHFTWLCAWESEYLTAFDENDFKRLVRAEAMLTAWTETAWQKQLDRGGAWTTAVIGPMKVGDPSGVKRDRTDMCAHAGIFNVRS